ncbi:WD repeat-containing protein 43-like [Plakobranchus ocellatus]|uniref:WD repeat-containing protein 43-like n=1 Tax=Plakobranchus ocellatus TaxID=259542 RepID=A0AAV4BDI3_9GAST|nr:WD repeat-containing protein 43-like [Plakobranchus ocellatus]
MASSLTCYSEDGEHLAHSSSDGILRIYECATGKLKQEYSSSSHLSAVTSSLSWSRPRRDAASTPKSKRKKLNSGKSEEAGDDGLNLIALGTTAGDVNLYSFSKGSLHTQLTGGHTLQVNDVYWHLSSPELFTCSEDQTVAQWDLRKGKIKHKWKCDNSSIHSVCQCSDQRLLTASHTIKLWDLSTRTVLQTLTGHSSPVFFLKPVWSPPSNSEATYVLSSAVDDRHISVWSFDGSKNRNSIASFSVPDEPVSLSLGQGSASGQSLLLAVITRKGSLHIFEHTLNGVKKKPLLPRTCVRASFKDENAAHNDSNSPAPIFATCVRNGVISVAFGNPFKPVFETVVFDSAKPEVMISVHVPAKSLMKEEFSQVKRPEISEHVTTLVPSGTQPQAATRIKGKNRSRRSSVSDLTVEERLNAMSTDAPSEGPAKQPPVANTLGRLLQQGLLSGDKKILAGVFQETNDTVVRNTIRRLPVSFIIPLVKEIERGMSGHAQHAFNLSRWTAALISTHVSYILSVPEIVQTLNKLYQTLAARQRFYPSMLQLKGRLELARYNRSPDAEGTDVQSEPVLVYQDESDSGGSDSMIIDGAGLESDENWEDLSDMET